MDKAALFPQILKTWQVDRAFMAPHMASCSSLSNSPLTLNATDYPCAGEANGPATGAWGGVCKTGIRQSPIDVPVIKGGELSKFGEIEMDWGNAEKVTVLNTGHGTMQVCSCHVLISLICIEVCFCASLVIAPLAA